MLQLFAINTLQLAMHFNAKRVTKIFSMAMGYNVVTHKISQN